MRKLVAVVVAPFESIQWWQMNCLKHQGHIIVREGLEIVDETFKAMGKPFKYYSSLRKIVNVWREKAKDFYLKWCAIYGAKDANAMARYLVPRCIAGRWGSVHRTEERVGNCTRAKLHAVSAAVLSGEAHVGDCQCRGGELPQLSGLLADGAQAGRDAVDELNVDEQREYRGKMGRWRRDVMRVTADDFFFAALSVSHEARAPLHHLNAILDSKPSGAGLDQHGTVLAQLICTRGASLAREMDALLDKLSVLVAVCEPELTTDEFQWLARLAARLALHNASAFHMRVTTPLSKPRALAARRGSCGSPAQGRGEWCKCKT